MNGALALVTGASRRIGRAVAVGLARAGHDVVVHHRGSAADAETTCGLVEGHGREAWIVRHDLDRAPQDLLDAAEKAAGRTPTVLVNNASTYAPSSFATLRLEQAEDAYRTNTWAPFALTRALAERRVDANVVNVLDTRVTEPDPEHLAYALSKCALLDLTRIGARALAPRVRVNAVAPGPILPPAGEDQAHLDAAAAHVPLRRAGTPEDVAAAVTYLATAPYVTGQVLFVDGGRHIGGAR